MAKIHYVNHTGANKLYFEQVLKCLEEKPDIEIRRSGLSEYVKSGNDASDVLCYQTFPDERHGGKFNPKLVNLTDELFKSFKGHKILVDTFDNGEEDAFTRFPDSTTLPRVKCFPSERFLADYNVILQSTISIKEGNVFADDRERKVIISCKLGLGAYDHPVRSSVFDQLHKFFKGQADFSWLDGRAAYEEDMKQTLIAVGAPGWGQYSATHQLALRTGALLFAYDSFNDVKYLPHAVMKDGVNFISYNLFNFKYKLQWLLDNPHIVERVRKNGRASFKRGFNPQKSAGLFYKYLKGRVL